MFTITSTPILIQATQDFGCIKAGTIIKAALVNRFGQERIEVANEDLPSWTAKPHLFMSQQAQGTGSWAKFRIVQG
jgi:hypothetical protein